MKITDAPKGCTNLKLRQLDRMVSRHYDHFLARVGLKNMQYSLLSYVVNLGPLRPGDLARHLRMDASTLSRNLQPMVTQGWLTIGAGPDARSRLVAATAQGHIKREEACRAWRQAQLTLNKRLGDTCVTALHNLLDSCIQALDNQADDTPQD